MCIIIDANIAPKIFSNPYQVNFRPIFDWCEKRDGCIVYGGKLKTELFQCDITKRFLKTYFDAGRAFEEKDEVIKNEEDKLDKSKIKSNDSHIIALARVTKVILLCTKDEKLIKDFKNKDLINPIGKIYKNKNHRRLLGHSAGCIGKRR